MAVKMPADMLVTPLTSIDLSASNASLCNIIAILLVNISANEVMMIYPPFVCLLRAEMWLAIQQQSSPKPNFRHVSRYRAGNELIIRIQGHGVK